MSEFIRMKLSEARAKFENLDELSRETVRTYYNKAGEQGKKIADRMKMGGGDWSNDGSDTKTLKKRAAGRTMALKRRSGEVKMSEESEQIDELSKETMGRYINKAKNQIDAASWRSGYRQGVDPNADVTNSPILKSKEKLLTKRHTGIETAVKKLTKEEAENFDEARKLEGTYNHKDNGNQAKVYKLSGNDNEGDPYHVKLFKNGKHHEPADYFTNDKDDAHGTAKQMVKEETEGCMLDTSMGGADQIAQSKTGEIYKKSSKQTTGPSPATGTSTHIVAGKTGEAMNTTAITRRVPAVESAVLDVMAKTFEKRKMFEDASNIAIISPEQRQDWLEVSKGSMGVVDYFNKYKV